MKLFLKTRLASFSFCLLPLSSLCANLVYLGNGSTTTISIVDTATNTQVGSFDLGGHPVLLTISPNNLFLYATIAGEGVSVVNTSTFEVVNIPFDPGTGPVGLALTPNGQLLYVADQSLGRVTWISTATNQILGSTPNGSFDTPWGIAITPDGKFAYVVEEGGSDAVSIMDLTSNTILPTTIPVGSAPTDIAITPDGQFAYITNENGGGDSTVSIISVKTQSFVGSVTTGVNPFEVTTSPNSQCAYVSNNAYTDIAESSISVISTATNQVFAQIPLGLAHNGPAALEVTPDGQTLYVTTTQDVTLISTATNQIIGSIPGLVSNSIAITNTLLGRLQGNKRINDFGMMYEYFNQLTWQPTPYSDVIGYNIYRNGSFLATVNSQTFFYDDHNQKKNVAVTYWVVPIEASGLASTPLSVTVQ